jgi:DNA invertase Pin-like site-specific DNA recombinase
MTCANIRGRRTVDPSLDAGRPGARRRIDGEVVVELHNQGLKQKEIARELRCSEVVVRRRLREAGIHTLRDPSRDGEIARRRAAGSRSPRSAPRWG